MPGWNWCRKALAEWLVQKLSGNQRVIVGIDHGFSFPISYMGDHNLPDWRSFLDHFASKYPTHEEAVQNLLDDGRLPVGDPGQMRLTEAWTPSAKSVFKFRGQGTVAYATHAGIPWLKYLTENVRVHFWPFDGFDVPKGVSVVAEVYPAMFKMRYSFQRKMNEHQRDAYAVCKWLQDRDQNDLLEPYFSPPLRRGEMEQAMLEGWLLGVM